MSPAEVSVSLNLLRQWFMVNLEEGMPHIPQVMEQSFGKNYSVVMTGKM